MTKILVVDDEPEIRSLLGAVLQSKGFEVVTAADGAAALEQVQREHPSVILMDLSMPRMNGMDALPEIKHVAMSNFCDIGLFSEGSRVTIVSAIDNLVKGASGQAVQNMNIMFKLDETAGLGQVPILP